MNRRCFLTVAGLATVAGRAGARTDAGGNTLDTGVAQVTETTEFELADVTLPDEVSIDEEFPVEITIANVGDADGRFVSPLNVSALDDVNWRAGVIDLEIPASEEATYTNESEAFPYIAEVTYRIPLLDATFSVVVEAATLQFGEPLVTPEDVLLRVQDVELRSSYEYESSRGTSEETAPDGSQWAFVWVSVSNLATERTYLPSSRDIGVVVDDRQFDEEYVRKEANAYESSEANPGISRTGWIAYRLPADVEVSDLVVSYSGEDFVGEWIGRWHAGETSSADGNGH